MADRLVQYQWHEKILQRKELELEKACALLGASGVCFEGINDVPWTAEQWKEFVSYRHYEESTLK